jgi:pimeloyl-ACP methyl ester carboxylesterase
MGHAAPATVPAPRPAELPLAVARRWPRRLAALLAAVCAACAAAIVATGWYLANRLVAVQAAPVTHPLRVRAVDVRAGRVALSRGPDANEPGSFRLDWRGGHAMVGPVVAARADAVTRRLSQVSGSLAVGQAVGIVPNPFTGNPRSALGIPFANVVVHGSPGPLPAWQIAGGRSTWAILVHGLGGSRADTLPAIPTLHALGFPMLAMSYRNDAGAAPSADHRSHLGATEWHDVEAAVRYALAHGAGGVVLYGWSLGAGMATVLSEQSPLRGSVRALVLDSPLLDWRATIEAQTRRHGIPTVVRWAAEKILEDRFGVRLDLFAAGGLAAGLSTPTLLIQGGADAVVPAGVAAAFARSRPDVVAYLPVPGADHVSAIGAAPREYASALQAQLHELP